MAAKIKKKPSKTVKNLKIERLDGRAYKASWEVPSNMTSSDKSDRAEYLEIDWILNMPGKNDPKQITKKVGVSATSNTFTLNSGEKIGKKTYTRDSFHPIKSGKYLYSLTVKVRGTNDKGAGKFAKITYDMEKPKAPVIAALSFTEQGVVSTTITTDAGSGSKERYDTVWKFEKYDSRTNKWMTIDTSQKWCKRQIPVRSHDTRTSIPLSYDVADYRALGDDYYIFKVTASARGFEGNIEAKEKTLYVSYPAIASINSVSIAGGIDSGGRANVSVKTNSNAKHKVDKIELEYLADVSYESGADIPGTEVWETAPGSDNATCTMLTMPVTQLIPQRGNHTYIRLKTTRLIDNVLVSYSAPKLVKEVEKSAAAPADIQIKIISVEPLEGGKSALVTMGWNADGKDDFTGTELTWSDEEDTWMSTEDPKSYEFTWSGGAITDEGVTYQSSAKIVVKGLEEGKKYWFKARRYAESDADIYSDYSNTGDCITTEVPESLVASASGVVPTGAALPVQWTFSGNGLQTEWQIRTEEGYGLASGQDSFGSTQIPADKLAEGAVNGVVSFRVYAKAKSEFIPSNLVTVAIQDAPVASIALTSPLTVQPFSFTAVADKLCDLLVIVTSKGITGQTPRGIETQIHGDTIYSALVPSMWTEDGDNFTRTVELPAGLDFWGGGIYQLDVTAVDRNTGLRTELEPVEFAVEWANPAVDPSEAVTISPVESLEDGVHVKGVEITLTPPTGCNVDDLYDIYRMDGDTVRLVGESFPLEHTVVDPYAPYGDGLDLTYRFALRTTDGDEEFADIDYVSDGNYLRFDWSGGYIEFPYDITIQDSYKKSVEYREHMDGSIDGYWNRNVSRTGKLSTNVIVLQSQDDIELTRNLARHPGAVFVRTPNGSAYEADVQISDMSQENSRLMAIAIDATEVGLTQEFMLPIPNEKEDTEEEEQG